VAMVSVDGKNFAEAKFPHNFNVDKQQAYTVLESVTNSVFLHVTVSARPGSEYGSILKSNSNGTQYVVSLENVNRDEQGFVDFEKMQGLEGVAVVNSVENPKEVHQGSRKKLKTKITHNDGAEWEYLRAPKKDSEGKDVSCNPSNLEKCSLNLHGYTERLDYRDTFSSQSAIGLMIGVGNVGEYLTPYQEGNTYLTRDGGITWQEIKKGSFMWEFGDSGSIVVIVNGKEPTNKVFYSLDEGKSWKEYQFSDDLLKVDDIATIPSDTSRKFLLLGRQPAKKGEKSFTVQIDFTGLTDRQCVLDPEDPSMSDFELWTPSHPLMEDNCLFGHEAQYHRKMPGKNCYIGRSDMNEPHKVIKNCTCTRRDFECDFNYQRVNDGTCKLVPGYSPPDHSKMCDEFPDAVEYWEPTGYRRIPLSTCQGGQELDHVVSYPCPGKEDEYKEKHRGLHGFGLFFVIVLPIGMTGVIGYILWDHYSKRYGQIRLGEEDDDQPAVIRYAIISMAAIVAVASVVPSVFKSVYSHIEYAIRSRTTRYTSRNAFARGRQRYTAVDTEDEGELLHGNSSDDDVMADSDDEL
jgi:hypothetical protein